jgi:hypothetical protein
VSDTLYREGVGLPPTGVAAGTQFSYVRRAETGTPQDTDDNAQDFVLIATDGAGGAVLGAPGPENLASPVQRNATIKTSLIDPQAVSTAPPNRVRDATPDVCGSANCAQGTLTIRRSFRNNTGAPLAALRFRVVDITTLNTPNPGGAQADLRALSSLDLMVTRTDGQSILVRGTTLDAPPAQALGGGHNSSLTVALPGGVLAPGGTVNVQFVLGVQAGGRFRFLVNIEGAQQNSFADKAARGRIKRAQL